MRLVALGDQVGRTGRRCSACVMPQCASLNELDSTSHLIGFEHFPDQDKARDDLAETSLFSMTVGNPGVLNPLALSVKAPSINKLPNLAVVVG